jgi:tyrosyl-tRNA synthetase
MDSDQGISYTEFSYMLLQAHDYLVLHEQHGCELQVGGSDQWGNITAGIDLIRRRAGSRVHGLTCPLLTRSDGRKFGKSEEGNLWLSADRTSPYRFYQYWINVPDDDVGCFLRQLTLLPLEEVTAIEARTVAAPQEREAQRALARELTTMVHGPEATAAAEEASAILFGGTPTAASPAALATVAEETSSIELPRSRLEEGVDVRALLLEAGLASSRSDANRTVEQGGAYVNDEKYDGTVGTAQLLHDRYVVVRKGKKRYAVVVVA